MTHITFDSISLKVSPSNTAIELCNDARAQNIVERSLLWNAP